MAGIEQITRLVNSLAKSHLAGSISSLAAIKNKGEVNQVYVLNTHNRKAILRVNDPDEYGRFKKEEWCIQHANKKGVPSPKVIAMSNDEDFVYMLLEYVEGLNGEDIVSTPELWEKLGGQLKLIHSIPTKGFGENLEDITAGSLVSWKRYLDYNISSLNDDALLEIGVINTENSKKLKAVFEKLADTNFSFALSHGDFSLANVILDAKSQPHIIDWGSAEGHVVPHHDLGVILDESLVEHSDEFGALLTGYGMTRTEFDDIKDNMIALQLLEAIDKVRWALDKAPASLEYQKGQLTKFLSRRR